MNKLLYILLLLLLFSCNQDNKPLESSETMEKKCQLIKKEGVVYPLTNMNAQTRSFYNDDNVDWINGSKVTLPNGQEVDLPWVEGGSLPFFMQQKLSPENGWELIAHTMAPDTQSDRSYLLFHNYITGALRFFCYMSTFATNNNGYWKISFSEPTSLLNFTGSVALPMNQREKTEIVVSNCTSQNGKGFALGWNGFQLELAYDPNASCIMKIEPMNINTTNISISGDYESTTEGRIVGTSTSSSTASNLINGVGNIAGGAAESWIKSNLPFVKIPVVGDGLLSLAKGGITSAFSAFSGLFDKKTEEIKDVSLTTKGTVKVYGTTTTQSAAPIAPVNIHLNLIDGYLGSWNLEAKPCLTWFTTVRNDYEMNNNVTNGEYFYQTQGTAVDWKEYILLSNPKNGLTWQALNLKLVKQSDLSDYENSGNMEYGYNAIISQFDRMIYDDKKHVIKEIDPLLRIRVYAPEITLNLPEIINLVEEKDDYYIIERFDRMSMMDIYLQVTCHSDFVINNVVNEYWGTRTFECKHDWGGAY